MSLKDLEELASTVQQLMEAFEYKEISQAIEPHLPERLDQEALNLKAFEFRASQSL
ncbi:hypothetical protein ICE98_00554 [Lactococcus lactis]|nr:hypothetical protein [Lactococcus lactis]